MKTFAQLVVPWLISGSLLAQAPMPQDGYVPDEKTAINVAEAVLSPIYGEAKVKAEEPFHAVLTGEFWTVSGSLPHGWDGGVAEVRIDKQTGKILGHIHYK